MDRRRTGFLAVLGLLVAIGALASGCHRESESAEAITPPSGVVDAESQAAGPSSLVGGEEEAAGRPGPDDDPHKPLVLKPVFSGMAVLRGEVTTPGGVLLPPEGKVILEPAVYQPGGNRAVTREVAFSADDPTFEFDDIPQAAYRVYAVAEGMNSRYSEVLLVEGAHVQVVTVLLTPAGAVDGLLLRSDGSPADGIEVSLLSLTGDDTYRGVTDGAGVYRFPGVRDGEYEIVFGQESAPLLPPQNFRFQGRVFQFPPRTLPFTTTVEFEVFGEDLFVVPGAQVVGFGAGGITIDALTEEDGIARVPYLRPGQYRVEARTEDRGRAHASFTLTDEGKPRRVRLALK